MEGASSHPDAARKLDLVFETAAAFCEQYARNLRHGGSFVPTAESFEPRELVEIRLDAPFADEVVRLRAEVVHQQPRDGVSVQFLAPTPVIRAQLSAILERARELMPAPRLLVAAPGDENDAIACDDGKQDFGWAEESEALVEDANERTHHARAIRHAIRMAVRVHGTDGSLLVGRTRNVSSSGLLLSIPGEGMPAGSEIELELLSHPMAQPFEIAARVVRQLRAPGLVPGVAVQLVQGARDRAIALLVEELAKAAASRRKLADHFGPGGPAGALRRLAALPEQGTVTVASGAEEAVLVLESGRLLCRASAPSRGPETAALGGRDFGPRAGVSRLHAAQDPGRGSGERRNTAPRAHVFARLRRTLPQLGMSNARR